MKHDRTAGPYEPDWTGIHNRNKFAEARELQGQMRWAEAAAVWDEIGEGDQAEACRHIMACNAKGDEFRAQHARSLTRRPTPESDALRDRWDGFSSKSFEEADQLARSLEQRLGAAVAALELMLEMYDNDDKGYDVRPVFARETLAAIKAKP